MTIPLRLAGTLRRLLKRRGLLYKDLAKAWDVSLPTVKRVMASGDLSLERLTIACELVGVSFFQLVDLSRDTEDEAVRFTPEQEDVFAAEPHLLAYFMALNRGATPAEIAAKHDLDARSTQRYLRRLEAIGLVERLTEGKVKLRRHGANIMWDNRGPIGRYYARKFVDAMATRALAGLDDATDDSKLRLGSRALSAAQSAELERELDALLDKYRRLSMLNGVGARHGEALEPLSYALIFERWRDDVFEAIPRI